MDAAMKTREIKDVSFAKESICKTWIEYAQKQHRAALDRRGFTLVELLVVIAIVAILAIIALPSFAMLKDLAKNGRAETEIRMLEKEIALYVVDNNNLPAGLNLIQNATRIDPWGNQYEYHIITGPGDPAAYAFTTLGTDPVNTDYDLYSKGKNADSSLQLFDAVSQDDIIRDGQIGKVVLGEKY